MRLVRQLVERETRIIESYQPAARGITNIWRLYLPDIMYQIEQHGYQWLEAQLRAIELMGPSRLNSPMYLQIMHEANAFRLIMGKQIVLPGVMEDPDEDVLNQVD